MGEDLGLPVPGVPVPAGTRLLHIGPHKTGTTSLQGAFHLSRATCLAQGVRYAGPNRHPVGAAQAVVAAGATHRSDEAPRPRLELWHRLLREIRSAPEPRVLISSEWFADAEDATIRRIVADLDPARTHLVVTVRPVARLLASQWQQHAQAGSGTSFLAWLESVLRSDDATAAAFWRRHRHDELVRRWADVAGIDRVTVVVADDRDHEAVLRAFEALVGLRPGSLRPEPAGVNRSLTATELEAIRAVNAALRAAGLGGDRLLALGLYGAAAALRRRTPAPGEPRLETPAWALERAAEIGAEIAAGLRDSGVRVIGDLDQLTADRGSARSGEGAAFAAEPWADVATAALTGVATAAGLRRRWPDADQRRELAALSSARLREVLANRVRLAITGPRPSRDASTVLATIAARAPSDRDDADAWRAYVGRSAVAVARAAGRLPAPGATVGATTARAAVRPRRRPTVETLELAGVPTAGLAAALAGRAARRLVPRPEIHLGAGPALDPEPAVDVDSALGAEPVPTPAE